MYTLMSRSSSSPSSSEFEHLAHELAALRKVVEKALPDFDERLRKHELQLNEIGGRVLSNQFPMAPVHLTESGTSRNDLPPVPEGMIWNDLPVQESEDSSQGTQRSPPELTLVDPLQVHGARPDLCTSLHQGGVTSKLDGQLVEGSLELSDTCVARGDFSSASEMGYSALSVYSPDSEYRKILQNASIDFELHHNIYAAAAFVLIKDVARIRAADVRFGEIIRLTSVLSCLVLNMTLQALLLYWIYLYLVLPSASAIRENYKEFQMVAFKSGEFDKHRFESLGQIRRSICSMAMASGFFIHVLVFIHAGNCAEEAGFCWGFVRDIVWATPSLPCGLGHLQMIYAPPGSNIEFIVCLSRSTRFLLLCLICIPRVIICFGQLMIGAAFLYASETHGALILNSCALTFVISLDELLYRVFLPIRIRDALDKTKVRHPNRSVKCMRHLSEMERAYIRNACFLLMAVSFVFVYSRIQPIIPGYKWDVHAHCTSLQVN